MRGTGARLALGALLGAATLICGIGLMASSGWLISRAAQQPPVQHVGRPGAAGVGGGQQFGAGAREERGHRPIMPARLRCRRTRVRPKKITVSGTTAPRCRTTVENRRYRGRRGHELPDRELFVKRLSRTAADAVSRTASSRGRSPGRW